MGNMFRDCEKLESVGDLSNWNVSRVTDMADMFNYCINLKSVGDLSNWNISNVKDMKNMFKNSKKIYIPKWYKG